nr:hypothetical protein [uncultured Ligilactobacillus sp.]
MLSKKEQQNLIQLSTHQMDEIEKLKRENETLKQIQEPTPRKLEIKKVIEVTEVIGSGTKEDPVREITSLYDIKNCRLIASYDHTTE